MFKNLTFAKLTSLASQAIVAAMALRYAYEWLLDNHERWTIRVTAKGPRIEDTVRLEIRDAAAEVAQQALILSVLCCIEDVNEFAPGRENLQLALYELDDALRGFDDTSEMPNCMI